jgi:hypothetical protein
MALVVLLLAACGSSGGEAASNTPPALAQVGAAGGGSGGSEQQAELAETNLADIHASQTAKFYCANATVLRTCTTSGGGGDAGIGSFLYYP